MTQTTNPPPVKPSPVVPIPDDGHHDQGGHDGGEHGIPKDLKMPGTGAVIIAVSLFVLLLVALFLVGWIPDRRDRNAARSEADARASALPSVSFTIPTISPENHDVTLPCNIKANQSTAIYTRTNGYLQHWYFDIGKHVDESQLMAVISTPEVDAQLEQSKAALVQNEAAVIKAHADLDLAKVTLRRYIIAQKQSPGSVTDEDVDTRKSAVDDAEAALKQADANVEAAKANVQQLTTQVGFEKVYAPFSGTVTARNYDVGALLSPTNTAAGGEIFDLQQTDPLRVFVNVPQEYANDVKLHEKANLFVRNFPAKPFVGEVALTAGAVDPNTRTLSVQINFPNKDGQLFAGEYGEIHLPVKDPEQVALIPTSALLFNAQAKGLQVAVLDGQNKVHMKSIKTGRDFGTNIEVTSGLDNSDKVITNPSERTAEGVSVQAQEMPRDTVTNPAPTTKPATMP